MALARPAPSGLPFLLLQLGGGFAGTALWAVLSHEGPALVGPAAATLAYGMVLYLPLTLGLPFVLPNLYRSDDARPAEARAAIMVVAGAATTAAIVAVAITAATHQASAWSSGLAFGAMICASATLQQVARILRSVPLMAFGSLYNAIVPGACLVLTAAGGGHRLLAPVLAGAALLVTTPLVAHARTLPRGEGELGPAVRRAAPLVPHMVAFGVLTQGVRLPASLTASDPTQPHSLMLVIGLALAVIAGVNSLLTVEIQTADDRQVRSVTARNARYYAALAFLGAVGVGTFYTTPLRSVFAGAAPLDPWGLVALVAIPPAFCLYFFGSALVLRSGRTGRLPAISVPLALLYVGGSVALLRAGASVEAALSAYAGTIVVLAAATAFAGTRVGST